MTQEEIIEEIKLELTGQILDLEIEDTTIALVIKKCLREVNRYFNSTQLVTIPFASCIDLSNSELDLNNKVIAITKVYRTAAYGNTTETSQDPLALQVYTIFSNGSTMYNLNDYIMNYASWNTLMQLKNTVSTDMAFKEDRQGNKLYINSYFDQPQRVTIEYIPRITNVEDIKSDYWIDVLIRMAVDMTKIVIGRIRTRYTQSNALWTQDGEKILEEGNTDLKELREVLRTNSDYIVGID